MLIAAIRALCGGPNLSLVSGLERLCANETIRTIQDISVNWSKLADVDVNATEKFRLQRNIVQQPAQVSLEKLHFWRLTESFFLKKTIDAGPASISANWRRLVACVLVTVCLSRPTTRCVCLSLPVCLSLSLVVSLSVSLSVSLTVSVAVSLVLSLWLSLSLCLSLSVSLRARSLSACRWTCVCVCARMDVCVHVCVCTYVCVHVSVYMCGCVFCYVFVSGCVQTCASTCTSVIYEIHFMLRAGVFAGTTLTKLDQPRSNYPHLTLFFEKHKTQKTYGVLVCAIPEWAVEVLQLYLSHIRPVLLTENCFVTTAAEFAFPKRATEFVDETLKKLLGKHNITCSLIRSLCCEVCAHCICAAVFLIVVSHCRHTVLIHVYTSSGHWPSKRKPRFWCFSR